MIRRPDRSCRRHNPALLLAAVLLAPAFQARALNQPLQVNQYAHTAWTARDGAQLGLVFSIAQTPDGYLWVVGSFGLFRFDGLRFVPWQPPPGQALPGSPYTLLTARDGTLWIGTFSGLARWDGRTLGTYPQVGKAFVTSLLEDREGTLWAGLLAESGRSGRLCAIRAGQVECSAPEGGFGSFVWSLAEDRAGTLWAGAESGLWRWKPGPPRRYPTPGLRVGDLVLDDDGQLLVGTRGGGLWRVAGDGLAPAPLRDPDRPAEWLPARLVKSNKLLRDRDGGLWIGTEGRGILHVKDGATDGFTRAGGLSGNIACSLFEDREGNVWFGSDKGLDRFRKLPVTTLSMAQGLPHEATRSVLATQDGSVWVATADGLARWKDGAPQIYREREGLPHADVQSLHLEAGGRLWASTAGGLAYLDGDRFVSVDGLPGGEVYSIASEGDGTLWLSARQGLLRVQQGRVVETVPWAALGRRQQAKMVLADRGGLWLAFWEEGGVLHWKDGRVQARYTATEGLGAGHVAGLRLDADGAVWAATEGGGLSRIHEGRVSTMTATNGLPCNVIHWSAPDADGALWLYTACGLVRVQRDDLTAWVADPQRRLAVKTWGGADGVPLLSLTPAYFNPPVARAADGRLWFVSGADVHVVDPAHLPFNPLPPPVHVQALVADQQAYPLQDGLELPPRVRDITIEFTGLSLADPKSMHFRYRLEGHDRDWQETGDRRQASYTNLAPGPYRFRVKASNNSGVWNEQGAELSFSIAPALHQTTWFRLAVAALLAVLAGAVIQMWLRMRLRRLQRQLEATLDARVAERTRIARDLHDTLLQRFHGLLLQFQTALNLLPHRPAESRQVLARAIDQVAEAITEGRDTVQGLRAATVEMNDLDEALRALADDLAHENGHTATTHVQVQGTPHALRPVVRDEAFRIAGEALRNAFRHAQARRIDVDVDYGDRQWRVRVRDDGQGMPPEVLRKGELAGHFGLSGMRERAELAGGRLAVRSAPGAGTEISLTVPGSRAYSRSAATRPWRLFRKPAPGASAE